MDGDLLGDRAGPNGEDRSSRTAPRRTLAVVSNNDQHAESPLQGGAKKEAVVARIRGPVTTFAVAVAASLALFAFAAIQLGLLHGLAGTPLTSAPPVSPAAPAQVELELLQLRERFDTFSSALGLLVAILVAVLAFGGISSASSWFNFEKRAEGLHSLTLEGQRVAQARDLYVFEQSKRTIDLVNSTLQIARDASRNAAEAVEQSARSQLRELETQAATMVAPALKEWRSLVTTPGRTAPLRALASRLNLFESMRLVFAQGLQPSPESTFVRGMESYLTDDFDEALGLWRRVVVDQHASDDLRILAFYWLGYVNDNAGFYDAAVESFSNAVDIYQRSDPDNPRKFELKRISLESRFFDAIHHTSRELLPQFESLLDELDGEVQRRRVPEVDEFKRMRTHLLVTFGNVYFDLGKHGTDDERVSYLRQAITHYERAREERSEEAKYARFGFAESQYQLSLLLGDDAMRESSRAFFRDHVLRDATDELQRRQEHRTQIRALTAQLICHLRIGDVGQADAVKSQIDTQLGVLDDRLTVFSVLQFRNVTHDQFRKDLEDLTPSSRS